MLLRRLYNANVFNITTNAECKGFLYFYLRVIIKYNFFALSLYIVIDYSERAKLL